MPGQTPPQQRPHDPAFALERLQALIVVAVTLVTVCTVLAVTGAPA